MSSKPNLIACAAETFLSEGLEDRLLSAPEIGNGVGRIKTRKIFSSKYIQFHCMFEPRHDLFRNTIFVSSRLTTQIV
jgi:hypothetical protein